MKNSSKYQEILLFTNTRFSSRKMSGFESQENIKKLSPKEKLKNACWNGLIAELLPEICEKNYDQTLTLWEVNEAESFLELQFGAIQHKIPISFSINPYLCLIGKEYN